MNALHYWILSALIVLTVGACAGGPDEDESARDVAADVVQAQVDAASAAGGR
jgi:hypothetical protein